MRIIDWSSDVCSSYLRSVIYPASNNGLAYLVPRNRIDLGRICSVGAMGTRILTRRIAVTRHEGAVHVALIAEASFDRGKATRSEEHTSELQSLMRISYAVFCLKKKKTT